MEKLMADSIVDQSGNGTPERVAYDLTMKLIGADAKRRKEILDLYAECLEATNNHRDIR
jgi:hypothetical protein